MYWFGLRDETAILPMKRWNKKVLNGDCKKNCTKKCLFEKIKVWQFIFPCTVTTFFSS